MASREEKIATFVSLSGADAEFAESFLEANDWDLNAAYSAFFDGAPLPTGTRADASSSSLARPGGLKRHVPSSGFDEQAIEKFAAEQGTDIETARAILEAQGESRRAGESSSSGMDDDTVRAPFAAIQGRLFEHGENMMGMSMGGMPMPRHQVTFRDFEKEARRLEAAQREAQNREREGGFGASAANFPRQAGMNVRSHADQNFDYEYESDSDDGPQSSHSAGSASEASARDKNLHALFEPPRELLFVGPFEEARAAARSRGLWVLVNIQEDAEFFSYVLNRDLWQNDLIRDIIKNNFVFFQHDKGDQDALTYARFYHPNKFPHIAVIHPLTGEQVLIVDLKTRANEADANDLRSSFLDKVENFLETNSMVKPATLPMPPHLTTSTPPANPLVISAPAPTHHRSAVVTSATVSTPVPAPHSAPRYAQLDEEPPSGENVTSLRIRLLGGKNVVRRFRTSHKVAQIYSFVHSLTPETETRAFDIAVHGGRSLLADQEKTLEELELLQVTLNCHWI